MADYATLLRDHITLTCRSIDRIFLQAYVPKLQSVGQVCLFLNRQRGFRIPSSAAFGQIGEAYVAAIHRWAAGYSRADSQVASCRPLDPIETQIAPAHSQAWALLIAPAVATRTARGEQQAAAGVGESNAISVLPDRPPCGVIGVEALVGGCVDLGRSGLAR